LKKPLRVFLVFLPNAQQINIITAKYKAVLIISLWELKSSVHSFQVRIVHSREFVYILWFVSNKTSQNLRKHPLKLIFLSTAIMDAKL